jgi:hypothetical protein
MPRPQKKKKSTKPIAEMVATIGTRLDRPPAKNVNVNSTASMATELAAFFGTQCSTKMDVAFIAAEMLLHMGRGQMAAQLGSNYTHADLPAIEARTAIFEYPATPNKDSTVEKLFLGFVKSIANHNPALRRQRWKTNGNSDLPFIAALSFLVGNLAWQNRAPATSSVPNPTMTRQNVKDAFDTVSAQSCPASTPQAGGGPFCDWMDL